MENLYTPNCIRTFSGHYLDVFDPDPDKITIEDIAHSLAMQPRFGGHTKRFFSVAEHSMDVATFVPFELKLEALLHDASDAYIGDMPSPIKSRLPDFQRLEDNLMQVIAKKFGFGWPISDVVKDSDRICLEMEWDNCVLGEAYGFSTHSEIKRLFLWYYEKYSNPTKGFAGTYTPLKG